jgi:putative transcriptional regulator
MKNKVKAYRLLQQYTQEQLADKLRVSRQTIIAIENNRYSPSLSLAFKFAKVFKQPIEAIFISTGDEDEV